MPRKKAPAPDTSSPKTPRSPKTPTKDEPGFEARLDALEGVVKDLEGEELPLEAAIARYQEGVGHLEACRRLLDEAERRLVELVETADGGSLEKDLDEDAAGLTEGS